MDTPAPSRRLAAIMMADVVGYSRLMERDEQGTHLRLREIRSTITDPAITRHVGRLVRSAGDDILAEFSSAVEALSCAVEIQRQMREYNRALAPESRIEFRIGINLGDILIDGSEIAGDGVNVAARLETLADPGGIAVSLAVREQVNQVVGVRLADIGEHRVKNLSRPLRVFQVQIDEQSRPGLRRWRRYRGWFGAAAATAAVVAIAIVAVPLLRHSVQPEHTVVVLPIADRTASADGAAIAEALTSQVTLALAQTQPGGVVAPSVAARYGTDRRASDLRAIGTSLGARYVVEASLLLSEQQARVVAQVIEADSGVQVWIETIDAARESQSAPLELVGRLADTIDQQIKNAELKRVNRTGQRDAYALTLRANALFVAAGDSYESLQPVRALLEEALRVDGDYVPALATAVAVSALEFNRLGSSADAEVRAESLRRADELSVRAITLGPNAAEAWLSRAQLLQYRGELVPATEAVERALRLNPYHNDAHALHGVLLVYANQLESALASFNKAIQLNPSGPLVGEHLYHRCRALLFLQRYKEAAQSCERATAFSPEWLDYLLLTASYAMDGDRANAERAKRILLSRRPDLRISQLRNLTAEVNPQLTRVREQTLIAGLRRAGIPE